MPDVSAHPAVQAKGGNVILLGLSDTAHVYGIPLGTLRRWLSEGILTRHGAKPYKVDLAEVEHAKQRRELPKMGE